MENKTFSGTKDDEIKEFNRLLRKPFDEEERKFVVNQINQIISLKPRIEYYKSMAERNVKTVARQAIKDLPQKQRGESKEWEVLFEDYIGDAEKELSVLVGLLDVSKSKLMFGMKLLDKQHG